MVAGRGRGRRLTRSETVADKARLMRRLAELALAICRQKRDTRRNRGKGRPSQTL
jgi:hypothetical protein